MSILAAAALSLSLMAPPVVAETPQIPQTSQAPVLAQDYEITPAFSSFAITPHAWASGIYDVKHYIHIVLHNETKNYLNTFIIWYVEDVNGTLVRSGRSTLAFKSTNGNVATYSSNVITNTGLPAGTYKVTYIFQSLYFYTTVTR